MGWRVQDAYERARVEEERTRFAALPLKDRFRIRARQGLILSISLALFALLVWALLSQ